MKRILVLKLPPFFPSRVGKRKRAPISKQTCSSQRLRSSIFLALRAKIKTFLANGSTQIRESTKRYREKMCPDYCIPSPIPFLIFFYCDMKTCPIFLEGKQYSNYFQEHDCLRYLKVPHFSSCYVAPEKGAENSNRVRNHVLESFSNIFFTLKIVFLCYF